MGMAIERIIGRQITLITRRIILALDTDPVPRYPLVRLGGSGAAEICEPRQVREEAAISKSFWVPPGCLPRFFISHCQTTIRFVNHFLTPIF